MDDSLRDDSIGSVMDDSLMDDSGIDHCRMGHSGKTNEDVPSHDPKIYITDEERQRALEVKKAVESCEHLKPLPDLEYVNLALTCNCSMEGILEIAYKLQCFREMYNLKDTVEDGIKTFTSLTELQPGFLLDISYLPSEECYTGICDLDRRACLLCLLR